MQISTIKLQQGESPFASLNEMREAHLSLLEQQGEQEDVLPEKTLSFTPQIKTFLRRGTGLGRSLDAPQLRIEAQNMLDYWVSTLSIHQRGMSEQDISSFSAAILERFDASVLESSVSQASRVLRNALPEKQENARKILMRLAPMSDQGDTFDLITVKTHDLTGGDPEQLALLEEFEKTGVVQRIESADGGDDSWRLVHQSVTHRWPEFAEWTTARRRFRQSAKLWDHARRAEANLPRSSGSLAEPLSYRDLNALESDYFEAATAAVNKTEKQKRLAIQTALAVLITGLCLVGTIAFFWRLAEKEKSKAAELTNEVQEELKTTRSESIQYKEESLEAGNKISTNTIDLRKENLRLRKELEEVTSDLNSIKNELAQSSSRYESIQRELRAIESNSTPEQQTQTSASIRKIESTLNLPQAIATQKRLIEIASKADLRLRHTKENSNESVAQALDEGEPDMLSPGVRVGSGNGDKVTNSFGSAGIFLTNDKGATFLASPSYVIGNTLGQAVKVSGKSIGHIEELIGNPSNQTSRISIARLKSGLKAENILPSVGSIRGWMDSPKAGTDIILIGQGSGLRAGKVLRITKGGNIVTTRISQPGDGGAPVVTKDGKLIGLLLQGRENESIVSPASQLLDDTGYSLLKTGGNETGLGGALAQLIVPISHKRYERFGKKLIHKFKKNGVFIPDGTPLLRAKTPAQTDIRYYDVDDQGLAEEIERHLRKMGFEKLKVYNNRDSISDGEAPPPRKFIQIAFNKEELDRVIRKTP